ncbi:NTP pyrophosphatase (non-canonical NTP hydrolase) [Ensifer sp. 4252]
MLKMQEEIGELTQTWNKATGRGRRHGKSLDDLQTDMADEAADLLGHVLLFAHQNDLDLVAAIKRKWKFQVQL